MPLANLCLTVCYTLLISLSDGTPSLPRLSIHVSNVEGQPDANYDMLAQPVLSIDGKSVLYDVSARFDQGPVSGLDKSIISYKQTNGYALVVNSSNLENPVLCLTTEISTEKETYLIPPLNAMFEKIMGITQDHAGISTSDCAAGRHISVEDKGYVVCSTMSGTEIMITSDRMRLNVTYSDIKEDISYEVAANGCLQVVKPFDVKNTLGRSLLNPNP